MDKGDKKRGDRGGHDYRTERCGICNPLESTSRNSGEWTNFGYLSGEGVDLSESDPREEERMESERTPQIDAVLVRWVAARNRIEALREASDIANNRARWSARAALRVWTASGYTDTATLSLMARSEGFAVMANRFSEMATEAALSLREAREKTLADSYVDAYGTTTTMDRYR